MATKLVMPKLGLTMTEGTIAEWKKNIGDTVVKGDIIFSVETDKLTNDVESDTEGVLIDITIPEGKSVPCGTTVGWIGATGEKINVADTASKPSLKNSVISETSAAEVGEKSVLVVGGGPGGYVAAIRAAQLGAKVFLIEKDKLGGTCLNRGCMPTKAMLHTSEIYEAASNNADLGILCSDIKIDWPKVQGFRAAVVDKLTAGVQMLCKANKIKLVTGEAKFIGPKAVSVGADTYSADKVIIATGSHPIIPDIPGMKECKAVIDSTSCLELDHIPESLLVIGGGVIGLELGSVYHRFGTKVTIIEKMPKLLPGTDIELAELLKSKLERQGLNIYTDSTVEKIESSVKGAQITVKCPNGYKVFEAENVLLAVGRAPVTKGLGFENTGIIIENGFISTNEKMETCVPGVYAIGDCTGKIMLAHAAMAMGEVSAENALGGNRIFNPAESPYCAYVGPELAGVGFTEEKANEAGIAYKVGRFPTSGNGRSLVLGETDGMVKVLAGERFGEIIGVHILAPCATELIQEAALAIKLEATLEEFTQTIYCHPTVSEAIRECALNADGKAIHIPNKKGRI